MTPAVADKEVGKSWPQICAILVVCLAPFTNGLLNAWSSPFIVKITKDKENYDISEDEASYFAFVPAISLTLTSLMFSKLNDFIGRKRTLLLGAIPCILAVIPTLMLGELFSASIKAKGLSVLSLVFALFQFLSSNIFYLLTANVGFYSPFLFFSICTFISSVLSVYLVPETKGKTLEEIQQSLKKNKTNV